MKGVVFAVAVVSAIVLVALAATRAHGRACGPDCRAQHVQRQLWREYVQETSR